MKLAYMIQAHKCFEQIVLLIDELKDKDTDIYIHIDKRNEILFEQLNSYYKNNNDVYIIENRIKVNWSGFTQVKATIEMIKTIIESNNKYDYISLISGQDFPIKSNSEIKKYLEDNKGKEFIEANDIGSKTWRLKCYNFFTEYSNNRSIIVRILDNVLRKIQKNFIKRQNFKGYELYYGSQWFTITYECLKYIYKYIQDNSKYIEDYKYTACSDEHFFQIIIMNSRFRKNVINDNLRYIDWSENKNSPKVLTIEDYDTIINSSKLIGRKFDLGVDKSVIKKIIKYRFIKNINKK